MANPLYKQYGNKGNGQMSAIDRMKLAQRISKDPEGVMKEALKTGAINQDWINKMTPVARQLQSMLMSMGGRR